MVRDDREPPDGSRKPSEFMRMQRPELYSDSVPGAPALARSELEYFLESLTARKQEGDFEVLCRRLAEREVCPNLRPQTGPTGGGDSKADATTYPIAPSLVVEWFWSIPNPPSDARWGFAFSAKKDWAGKVRKDVAGLSECVPKFERIYCITSQYTRDKKRGDVEKELFEKYGIPVHILDREWMLTVVFERGHEQLVIDSLHLQLGARPEKRVGPRDAQRTQQLKQVLERLKHPEEVGSRYALVEEYLEAAGLARELERPRVETEGYLLKARDLAASVGHRAQQLRATYQHAWTVFWWFDDAAKLCELYDAVAAQALQSTEGWDRELCFNLWLLLVAAVSLGHMSAAEAQVATRHARLRDSLQPLVTDKGRPTNALHARALRCCLLIHPSAPGVSGAVRAEALKEFASCFDRSRKFPLFPAQHFADMVTLLGDMIGEEPGYDAVFDAACGAVRERASGRDEGRLLLRRAAQHLKVRKPALALACAGKARYLLASGDSAEAAAHAALVCAEAYRALHLFWAARMEAIFAAQLVVSRTTPTGTVSWTAVYASLFMARLELHVGRIPCFLSWIHTAQALMTIADWGPSDARYNSAIQEIRWLDGAFGGLVLQIPFDKLEILGAIVGSLRRVGLEFSRTCALYALGDLDGARSTGFCSPAASDPDLAREFHTWMEDQLLPGNPVPPEAHEGSRATYRSIVLGCDVTIDFDVHPDSIILAENMLGALEAFVATAGIRDFAYHRSSLALSLQRSKDAPFPPPFDARPSTDRTPRAILVGEGLTEWTAGEGRELFLSWIHQVIAWFLASGMVSSDPGRALDKLGAEQAYARVAEVSPLAITLRNVMLMDEMLLLPWMDANVMVPKRFAAWWTPIGRAPIPKVAAPAVDDVDIAPHDARFTDDIINVHLWNEALWEAVVYATTEGAPPVLGILFGNPDPAVALFKELRERLGEADAGEHLRISIVEHDDGSYAVHVSPDSEVAAAKADKVRGRKPQLIVMPSRVKWLDSGENLARFKGSFAAQARYLLAPVVLDEGEFHILWGLTIEKRQIHFRTTSDVKDDGSDRDAVVLRSLRERTK